MSRYRIIDTGVSNPDISIAMVTYNHSQFIAQALDSILMQETTYSYKIIVAEDGSTDDTRDIILTYQAKYPDKFKVILQNANVGASKNNEVLMANLEGKYIAALEGDDYWTDPLKLQKQVDFLEKNPECGMVHTNCLVLEQKTQKIKKRIMEPRPSSFSNLLLGKVGVSTLTACFRKECYLSYNEEIKPFSKDWLMGDLPLWLYVSQIKEIHYMDEVTGVYRVLEESAYNTKDLNKYIQFESSVLSLKLFFWEKYISEDYEIKKNLISKFRYNCLVANVNYSGSLIQFFSFFLSFHGLHFNNNISYFFGSFYQILKKTKRMLTKEVAI